MTASSGRAHGGDKSEIDESSEQQILAIVPAPLVEPLAQQLNGRLCAVLLALGHVQVVYVDDEPLACGRAEYTLAPLVHLRIQQILRHVRTCVRRECESQRDDVGSNGAPLHFGCAHEVLVDVDSLARTRVTHHEHVLVVG